jgi:hypothetical protein
MIRSIEMGEKERKKEISEGALMPLHLITLSFLSTVVPALSD